MSINLENFKPKSENHLLNKMWDNEYGSEFQKVIKDFSVFLNTNKKLKNLQDKLFLNQNNISTDQLNQYIQSAVELTVVRYFANNYPENFKYEPNLIAGNNTDVECQFKINNLTFNIEVKASKYINDDLKSNDEFYLRAIGMGNLDNYNKGYNLLKPFLPNLKCEKRYDNSLKSHLTSTQSKLPRENNNDFCNVLIIGCNNSDDIQNQYHYLFSRDRGFFSENPLIQHSEFDLVDIIFLSNLFYKHNSEIDETKLNKESWLFEKSFIVGFRNPYRKSQKLEHLELIESIIPNYTKSFMEYKGGPDFFRLKHFIHTELGMNRKIYHF
ncbi:conserved hypothetical protein [Flavobacterium sp. 9R]|uniref:hypothetical protein n=1 Tax=Flavobacterium sp. 9R TaxID=2653143 RepID=UPI0012F20F3D|nr:hypothetical protein [Flavobacterium sp. 9R]VXC12337.1 conserved hypothetical protein [Flavobacterium sp. 9R]